MTVREMARLHGFPDWFRFHVTKWNGARQIGNSVPPPLAKAVATKVSNALKSDVVRPNVPISLGDSSLLSLSLTEAARYFGVVAPVRRRNIKSGAKKRKQQDIERSANLNEAAE